MGQQTSRDPAVVNEGKGKVALNLAHQGLKKFPVERVRNTSICEQVTKIDIGHNEIESVEFLRLFPTLEDLYMDGNLVTHMTKFPHHENLKSLSLNGNQIGRDGAGGTMCVDKISKAFPKLTFLSLIHNPGCPSYFSGSSQPETEAFRNYCIAKLPNLEFLDSSPVGEDEREEAVDDMEEFVSSKSPRLGRKKSSKVLKKVEKEREKEQKREEKEQQKEDRVAEKAEKLAAKNRLKDQIDKDAPETRESYCLRCRAHHIIELTHDGTLQHCPKCLQPFTVAVKEPPLPPAPPALPAALPK